MPRVISSFAILSCIVFLGCSRNTEGPKGKLAGKVTLDGKAITQLSLQFENKDAGVDLTTPVDADGNFEVKNYKGAGLPVGTYRIAVIPGGMISSPDEIPLAGKKHKPVPPGPKGIPEKYLQTGTSGLTVEIKEGDNPALHIELSTMRKS